MNDFVTSHIRTYVPVAVGALLTWLTTKGIEVDLEASTGLIVGLSGLFTAVYYFVIRLLEKKWPSLGCLLGSAKTPEYK